MQRQAVFKPIIGDIAGCDIQRVSGDIHRVDLRLRKGVRGQNRKAARAGAEIKHILHRTGIVDQRIIILVARAEMRIQ